MTTKTNRYDAIVVGSGIGGLTAAVELAAKGAHVLVLEQHYLLGGACTTYSRKGGFKFDAGVESISGLGARGPVNHLLARHGLSKRLVWLRNSYGFRYDDKRFDIPDNWDKWRDLLKRSYPHEADGIHSLFKTLRTAFEGMYTVFAPDRITPKVPEGILGKLKFAVRNPSFVRWMNRTWGELLNAYVKDPELIHQMSMLTGYLGDAGLDTPASGMLAIMGYFIDGGYRPQGGSMKLAEALVEALRQYGGEAKINTDVTAILVENGRVSGVSTTKGDYYAPIVISNVDPLVTFKRLVGLDRLPAAYRKQVEALKPSMSLYIWSAALSRPFPDKRLISVRLSRPIELPKNGITLSGYSFHSPAACDPSLVPEGCGNIVINFLAEANASHYRGMSESEYAACKEEIDRLARSLLKEIDAQAESSILFSEVSTPKTIERYMRTYEGSIYSTKIDKAAGFPSYKTPIQGLYLASAGVGHGPGIEAVVITGAEVAELIAPTLPIQTAAGAR